MTTGVASEIRASGGESVRRRTADRHVPARRGIAGRHLAHVGEQRPDRGIAGSLGRKDIDGNGFAVRGHEVTDDRPGVGREVFENGAVEDGQRVGRTQGLQDGNRRRHPRDVVQPLEAGGHRRQPVEIRCAGKGLVGFDDDQDGLDGALAVLLLDEVVARPHGRTLRQHRCVDIERLQSEGRRREGQQCRRRDRQRGDRPGHHHPGQLPPAAARPLPGARQPRHRPCLYAVAEQVQHRGQDDHAGEDGQHDDDDGGDRHRADDRHVDDEQRRQRGGDRCSGGDYRASGGSQRGGQRGAPLETGVAARR